MTSSVRSRPNHYEALGLTPAASEDDIRRAFVGKMSVFGTHPIAEAGQILIAYETLREPSRRKAYDESLGLNAKPTPREWSFSVTPPRWAPFIAAPPNEQPAQAPVAEPPSEPHVAVEAPRRSSPPARSAQSPRPRQPDPDAELDVVIQHVRAIGRAEKDKLRRAQPESPSWKRIGLALGGLVVGAGLIGTLAGLSVKDNADSAALAEPANATGRPTAKESEGIATPLPAPLAEPADSTFDRPVRASATQSTIKHSDSRPGKWAEQMAQSLSAEANPSDAAPVEGDTAKAGADAQPAQAVAADLPLSSRLVARTIDRIGYACGQVASTAPVEGEGPGVYKITCSSGQSYRAAPVGGRYHFRRLGR